MQQVTIRRTVSILGTVKDAVSMAPIAGANIAITAGPAAFESQVATLSRDPAWQKRMPRLGLACSRADGSFYFLTLPPGAYRLRASVPKLGSRYGTVESNNVSVRSGTDDSGRPHLAQVEILLPPTRIHGQITYAEPDSSLVPIKNAQVRLRGDTLSVPTDNNGDFALTKLVSGRPTLQVSAPGFLSATQDLSLDPGQTLTVNVTLVSV